MIYLLIDTNVFISILLDSKEYEYSLSNDSYDEIIKEVNNEEKKEFEYKINYYNKIPRSLLDLKILCENEVVKLIVTEVTKLELKKANNEIRDSYNKEYKKLKDLIREQKLWNEVKNIKNDLEKIIDKHNEINIKNWSDGYRSLTDFLEEDYNVNIKLTADIICDMYKKKISGEISERQSNDFLFINSAYSYLKDKFYEKNDIVFLVTKDKKDFFKREKIDVCGINCSDLHERFKDNIIKLVGLNDIRSLYKYINSDTKIKNFVYKIFEEESKKNEDVFFINQVYNNQEIKKRIVKKFNEIDKSIDIIKKKRIETISNIRKILNDCRQLTSWDNRSELKLYEWLEGKSEEEFEILKLSELLLIKKNLIEYYKIHLGIDK